MLCIINITTRPDLKEDQYGIIRHQALPVLHIRVCKTGVQPPCCQQKVESARQHCYKIPYIKSLMINSTLNDLKNTT